ncbi:XRE family transcriptional regulator [Ideonella sp. 4Y11]|uniref:XRE family transcriptional regulator n=1 Tax=Ideonella aquatica TaxID=2824119 RepID=A0A940YVJ2_9BURK|nr:helix-turn-helix transcriptional regulator [Ideonella aquatica]MBQ0960040.1 XRE family transcriptional regulator [Ideonella aquatica]
MSTTQALIQVLKAELKAAGWTYAVLARELGLAESSVKRMFARGDMPLARVDAICALLKTDFTELSRRVAASQPERHELTLAQERAVVADRKLLLMAVCCQSQWTLEQVVAHYRLSEAEGIALLAQLDRLGIIELRPHNRYRLKLAKAFRWRPHGPVMAFFREQVVGDFFGGGFDGDGELLTLVHGQIRPALVASYNDRLQRLAQDFAQQHLADQKLPPEQKQACTLLIGMRSWLFGAFRELRRSGT